MTTELIHWAAHERMSEALAALALMEAGRRHMTDTAMLVGSSGVYPELSTKAATRRGHALRSAYDT